MERELREVRAEGGARLPFDPEDPPVEEAPAGPRAGGPRRPTRWRRGRPRPCSRARACTRRPGRSLRVLDEDAERWSRHERAAAEAGGLLDRDRHRAARRPHRRADARARRARRRLRRRDGAHLGRPGPPLPLGEDHRRAGSLRAAGRGRPRSRRRAHDRRRDELPGGRGVPPRGHAVARPRQGPLRSPGRARRTSWPRPATSTSRSAAARTAAASTTSRASASRAACGGSAAGPRRSTS